MMNDLLNAALTYADTGFPVFPCKPGRKVPLTEHGFKDATTDPEQIEAWWTEHPEANIAIPTISVLAVDIDGPDNPWPADPGLDLDPGAVSLTPGGGRHLVYRMPAGRQWHNTAGKLALHVDTRAAGGYIVVPPSCDTRGTYSWAEGCELEVSVDELPEPPPWLIEQLDALEAGSDEPDSAPSGPLVEDGHPVPSGQRNDTLARLAGVMRRAGRGEAELRAALLTTNTTRCNPPLPEAEVEKIAWSVARYAPDLITVALVEDQWAQMQDADEEEGCQGPQDPGAFPKALLVVPGLVGQVVEYCLATSHKPQPILALAGAICLQAVLAARKVHDQRGNQTNLYIVAVAESGRGKERPRQVNRDILFQAGQGHLEGPEEFASDSGLIKAVELQPAILFQIDEIGRLLKTIGDHRQSHLYNIASVLIKLYSCAGSVFQGKAYADEKRNAPVHYPCVTLFGCTVPMHLYESLTTAALDDGFLARLLVIESDENPPRQMVDMAKIPLPIIERARWWGTFRPGGNLSKEHPEPYLVPYSAEAVTIFDTLAIQVDKEAVRGNSALWARVEEKACRLALVYACSRDEDPESWVIDGQAAQWASDVGVYLTRRLVWVAERWVADSEFDSKQKKVLRLIDKMRGSATQHQITRAFQSWKAAEREEVLANMLMTRQIVREEVPTGGAPKTIYRVAGSAK